MPKSRELSKPRKPQIPSEIDKNRFYIYRVESILASHAPISDVISLLEKVVRPEDCILTVGYSNMKISRRVLNEISYNLAVRDYDKKMEKYNKKMEEYNKKMEEMIDQDKNIKQEKSEKAKQEEFEKLDSTGKRFAMLEFD